MDVLIGGVGIVLLVAAIFGIRNPKVYEDLRLPLDTRSKRLLAIALGAVFASIGLGWIRPPAATPVNSVATIAALGVTAAPPPSAPPAAGSGTATATASPTPAGTRTITRHELHWTSAVSGGAILDGGVYTPHKRVWLEEAFPSSPPEQFDVVENIDPALPAEVKAALQALAPPGFGVVVNGHQAMSAQAWQLPDPIAGLAARSFSFRDVNADGTTSVAGSIVSGYVSIRVESGASGCLTQSSDGTFVATKTDTCLQLSVQGSVDPTLETAVMVPWGADEEDLVSSVRTSFGSLATVLGQQRPAVKFDPNKAMATFQAQNGPYLPAGAPDGWNISTPQGKLQVAPGKPVQLQIVIHAPTSGQAMIALKLIDPADPTRLTISQLIRVVAAAPAPSPSATATSEPSASPEPSTAPVPSASPLATPVSSPADPSPT